MALLVLYVLIMTLYHSRSDNIVRQLHPIGNSQFNEIIVNGVFNVQLIQSESETSVEIEASKDVQNHFVVDIQNTSILSIRMIPNYSFSSKIIVYIKFKDLKQYNMENMVGNTNSTNEIKQNQKFILYSKGTGNVNLKLNVPLFEAHVYTTGQHILNGQVQNEATIVYRGVGDIDALNLVTKKMNVNANGVGNIRIMATDEINIDVSGVTTVFYKGPLNNQKKYGLGRVVPLLF
ncbi:unnamed protein product [Didymodactylos carnosus]|uniref:Putative auto-transporter adhesin head GIN domain-containing protein n=1 Tax=Didymodactylos carnosus TaxID=1234261 RepID=A0A814UW53_9BILA|nr:unnamed protein product [Didymodactylos carnosus]CAF1605181.1 unnamed protein product [Didymodactylos carnosus]CAF3945828.1 unnamed protein product [Didymodactylos carnosus]CAF4415998.1 unnamed protein product [Didymodactylos carnosus]